jgi:hypothetical protein
MQVMYMNEYLEKMVDEAKKKNRVRDKYDRYQGDYNHATNELTDFWLTLQQANCGIVFIAHEKIYYKEDEDGNPTSVINRIVPDLTPAVRDSIKKFINVVAYLEKTPGNAIKKEDVRKLYVNKTNTIMAKNRLGITQPFLENPKFNDIFKGVNNVG